MHKLYNSLDDIKVDFPTIESYKQHMLTSNFWANEWAIKIIEDACNIQCLLFNETQKDIIGCRDHSGISGRIDKNPNCILINWIKPVHFQLITFKDPKQSNKELGMVEFNNLPKNIQNSCPQKSTSGGKKTKKKYIKKQKISKNKKIKKTRKYKKSKK